MVRVQQNYAGIQKSVQALKKNEEQQNHKIRELSQEVRDLKEKMEKAPKPANTQSDSHSQMELLKLKADQLKNNLIIEGIAESETNPIPEDEALEAVKTFFQDSLQLNRLDIDSAYRLGKLKQNSKFPRSILVKFIRPKDREAVWRAKSKLTENRNFKISIKEDLPPSLRVQMSALLKVLQVSKRYPDTYQNVFIKDYRIHVNEISYGADQLESLPRKLRPSEFSTPGNIDAVVFYTRNSRFSNHYHCSFEWDQKTFSSMEQYLAYRRAKLAGRRDLLNRAMHSQDPAESKKVMNELRSSPSEPEWIEARHDILFSGLIAKFSQNRSLMNYLMESENRKLGEASRDTTWGIGLTLTDKNVLSPEHWQGENLLGNTLMEVRQELSSWLQEEPQASQNAESAAKAN